MAFVGVVSVPRGPTEWPARVDCLIMYSVLKRCVPKTLAFAFGLRLRSKTRCFKTRVLGRRLPNGKPQERLRFRALRSKTLAFRNRSDHFLRFKDFPRGQGLRLGALRSQNAAFCVCVLKPTELTAFAEHQRLAIGDLAHLRSEAKTIILGGCDSAGWAVPKKVSLVLSGL